MTSDMPEPREADGKISPMMAGLSTFEATANPVRNRAKMKRFGEELAAARTMPRMKIMFATLKVG